MGFGVDSVGSGEVWMVLLRSGGSGWYLDSLGCRLLPYFPCGADFYEVLTSPVGFWVQFIFQD